MTKGLLMLVSIGIIAGYTGRPILCAASKNFGDRLSDFKNEIGSDLKGFQEDIFKTISVNNLLSDASNQLAAKNPAKAALRYSQVLDLDSGNAEARIGQANLLVSHGKKEEREEDIKAAITEINDILAKDQGNGHALYTLARLKLTADAARNKDEALSSLAAAVKAVPGYAQYAEADKTFEPFQKDPAFIKAIKTSS